MNTVSNEARQPQVLPEACIPWMRFNHAGETGAVWIYRGASLAFWSSRIRRMALEHGPTEQKHLQVIEAQLPARSRSRLLPLWRLLGFGLGLLPAIFGYRIFCLTIYAVETFVERHYLQQDALQRMGERNHGFLASTWMRIVGFGSDLAVRASLRI